MKDDLKTREQLVEELVSLRQQVGTAWDVAGYKQVEKELRLSQQRLALHIQRTPLAVIEFDLDGRITEWNPAAVKEFGFTREEVIGRHWTFIVPEEVHPYLDGVWESIVTQRGGSRSTNENRTKNGDRIVCEWFNTPLVGPDHKTIGVASLVMNVTEWKQAESALRASEFKFRTVAYYTADWEYWQSPEGKLLYTSPACEKITGYRPEEFSADAELLLRIVQPEDRGELIKHLQHVSGEEDSSEVHAACFRIIHREGGVRWIEHVCRPVRNEGGRYLGRRVSNRDITDRKRLEDQLLQAQKIEAVGQLAGGVAHDFNNILAAIMMRLGLLLEDRSLATEVRESLNELEEDAKRAADLTRQLLLFGRRQVMQIKVLDLNDLLGNLLKMLRRLLGEQIKLGFEGDATPLWIEADPGMMEQVVMNLCVNARDAMPKGGDLILRTQIVDVDERHTHSDPEAHTGRFVCLTVSDQGCGMDNSTLARIFEPFFTTKEVGKGSGLGLATVHGIVKQHRGWVEAESAVGQGSIFQVYLPVSTKAYELAVEQGKMPVARGNETILLVEDEPNLRDILAQLLRRQGYTVIQATDGIEAMQKWEILKNEIRLLYTDMVMPGGMTGLELGERLRSQKPDLRILITSGYSIDLLGPAGSIPAGVTYLPKPCDPGDLIRVIREILDKKFSND